MDRYKELKENFAKSKRKRAYFIGVSVGIVVTHLIWFWVWFVAGVIFGK